MFRCLGVQLGLGRTGPKWVIAGTVVKSVMVCKMWATHTHLAFVVKAHWKGAVDSSAILATCFAIVPCAKIDAAWDNNSESLKGSCRSPPHKQMRNWDSSNSKPTDGVDWITSSLSCWRGWRSPFRIRQFSIQCFQEPPVPRATCAFQCDSPTTLQGGQDF